MRKNILTLPRWEFHLTWQVAALVQRLVRGGLVDSGDRGVRYHCSYCMARPSVHEIFFS